MVSLYVKTIMLLLLNLGVLCGSVFGLDFSLSSDIQILSELPIDKLLKIKKTFVSNGDGVLESGFNATDENPQALALQSTKSVRDRGGSSNTYHYGHYVEDYPKKSSKVDIQSIFQISITTLAFLAFGGYLICLLVQAINGKSNNYDMSTATQVMSALISSQIRKRATTRAPQRLKRPTNGYRRKRKPRPRPRPKRDLGDTMYFSLIDLSEGYTEYHTENYLMYNSSSYL